MNYVLISIWMKIEANKKGGDSRSSDRSNGIKRAIADQRTNQTRFMMNANLTVIRADLSAEKEACNRGEGRGFVPGHSP